MKKVMIGALVGFLFFALVVGGTLFYLSSQETDETTQSKDTQELSLPEDMDSTTVENMMDSLQAEIASRDSIISSRDSVNQVLQDSIKGLVQLEERVTTLSDSIDTLNKREVNVKNLAGTYERMDSEELAPILKGVEDRTIIGIYEKMSSRKRQNLIRALPPDRAAQITKRLSK